MMNGATHPNGTNNQQNSLELSLLENEIDKISSKYQLANSSAALPFQFSQTLGGHQTHQHNKISSLNNDMTLHSNFITASQNQSLSPLNNQLRESKQESAIGKKVIARDISVEKELMKNNMIQQRDNIINQQFNQNTLMSSLDEYNFLKNQLSSQNQPQNVFQQFQNNQMAQCNQNNTQIIPSGFIQPQSDSDLLILQNQKDLTQMNINQQNLSHDMTLNRQGMIPKGKLPKGNEISQASKINPKELSNEELEYIIRTGKIPPRYSQPHPEKKIYGQQDFMQTSYSQNQTPIVIQQIINKQQDNQHHQPSFTSATELSTLNNSVNQDLAVASLLQNQQNLLNGQQNHMRDDYINIKHYNSPRTMPQNDSSLYQQDKYQKQSSQIPAHHNELLTTRLQSIPIQETNELISQYICIFKGIRGQLPSKNALNHSTQNLQKDSASTLDTLAQSTNSKAATQALKALSDKIKQLEQQNSQLQQRIDFMSQQQDEKLFMAEQQKRQEIERIQKVESSLQDQISLLKRQVDLAEGDKIKLIEENAKERESGRQKLKALEEENRNLRGQLEDTVDQYQFIECTIQDIKRREQQLRERCERAVDSEKEKGYHIEQEIADARQRYNQLKQRLKEKNQVLFQENQNLREEIEALKGEMEMQVTKLTRDAEKWKRENILLKEEISIIGGSSTVSQKDFTQKGSGTSKQKKVNASKQKSQISDYPLQTKNEMHSSTESQIKLPENERIRTTIQEQNNQFEQTQRTVLSDQKQQLGSSSIKKSKRQKQGQILKNNQLKQSRSKNTRQKNQKIEISGRQTSKENKNRQAYIQDRTLQIEKNNSFSDASEVNQLANQLQFQKEQEKLKTSQDNLTSTKLMNSASINKDDKVSIKKLQIQLLNQRGENKENYSNQDPFIPNSNRQRQRSINRNQSSGAKQSNSVESINEPVSENKKRVSKDKQNQKQARRSSQSASKSRVQSQRKSEDKRKKQLINKRSRSNSKSNQASIDIKNHLNSISTNIGYQDCINIDLAQNEDTKQVEKNNLIFIQNNPSIESKLSQSYQQQPHLEYSNQEMRPTNQNQFKRPSVESIYSLPFKSQQHSIHRPPTSNYDQRGDLYSHQSSIDHQSSIGPCTNPSNNNNLCSQSMLLNPYLLDPMSSQMQQYNSKEQAHPPLELKDFISSQSQNSNYLNSICDNNLKSLSQPLSASSSNLQLQVNQNALNNEKQQLREGQLQIDNDIFDLEKEIFEYNQQYKNLLSQQSNSILNSTYSPSNTSISSSYVYNNAANLNVQLRQVAQLLEEKSQKLFELKKLQQKILLQKDFRAGAILSQMT